MKRLPNVDPRLLSLLLGCLVALPLRAADASPPNVILCMADDLGWQDVGFNGNDWIQTPNLDKMAAQGIRFERFYSASAVCSPTRASCLTGRNPFRTGVFTANNGILRPEEITIAELLRDKGYATGMFGKWHLGTFTKEQRDANRGRPKNAELVNRPDEHGFDLYFATESKVPTCDPMKSPSVKLAGSGGYWDPLPSGTQAVAYGTHYWTNEDGQNRKVAGNLDGDDSRVIMDRALPFIEQSVKGGKPFLAVIWFHAPHLPCVSSPEFLETYKDLDLKERNYAGCISGLDQQMGRLRSRLAELGVADNTMVWFCSDNGPEGQSTTAPGSAGPLKGRKRSLHDGGIRVPGVVVWPAKIKQGRMETTPCMTSDYIPTIMEATGIIAGKARFELDGVSLIPLLDGKPLKRETPLCFQFKAQANASTTQYKYYQTAGREPELYDMLKDPGEQTNLADGHPDRLRELRASWRAWQARTRASFEGREYGTESVERVNQKWLDVLPQRLSGRNTAESDAVLQVPASSETLHVAVPLRERNVSPDGMAWQLVELGRGGTTATAQMTLAVALDGSPTPDRRQLVANIPPRSDGDGQRRFAVQPVATVDSGTNDMFRFGDANENSLGLWQGKAPVLAYNHGTVTNEDVPESDHRRSRSCYIHPVYGLNGEILTDDFPRDHYHHHGIFWTWPHVKIGDAEHDLWAGNTIEQRFVSWLARDAGPVAAVLGVENGWFVGDKKVMTERVWLRAYRQTGGRRSLDISLVLIPVDKPVKLLGAEGKSYGGLTMRFAPPSRRDADTVITTPLGRTDVDVSVTRFPWADFTSKLAGHSTQSGGAIFVHPDHPDYPPTWLLRHYGPLCVGWPGVVTETLAPGVPVQLDYRIWIHDGVVDAAELAEAYAGYEAALNANTVSDRLSAHDVPPVTSAN